MCRMTWLMYVVIWLMHVYAYTYIYLQIYIHKYTCIHIHTYRSVYKCKKCWRHGVETST
jgi:hypothetical protein